MKMKPIQNRKAWTTDDNTYIVAMYMNMLDKQERGEKFVKSREVKIAMFDLDRTSGSIECKLMNISAIRQEQDLSIIKGYKALKNYQAELKSDYMDYIAILDQCREALGAPC